MIIVRALIFKTTIIHCLITILVTATGQISLDQASDELKADVRNCVEGPTLGSATLEKIKELKSIKSGPGENQKRFKRNNMKEEGAHPLN